MKRTLREIEKELDKLKEANVKNDDFDEVMEKIRAKRKEFGDINEYEVLLENGAIEAVEIPDDAVNLFPYIKEEYMVVKEALKLPENKKIIKDAKLKAERESKYFNQK